MKKGAFPLVKKIESAVSRSLRRQLTLGLLLSPLYSCNIDGIRIDRAKPAAIQNPSQSVTDSGDKESGQQLLDGGGTAPAPLPNPPSNGRTAYSYYPAISPPEYLYAIKGADMSPPELLLIESLQGILAQTKPQIYIDAAASYKLWLGDLSNHYKIKFEYVSNPWSLVERFREAIASQGYILFQLNTESQNAAFSLCGVLRALCVDESLVKQVESLGFKRLLDVRGKSQKWALDNYKNDLNRKLIIEQAPQNHALRDYGVAVKGLYYYGSNSAEATEVFQGIEPDSPSLGWGPGDESLHVSLSGQNGIFTVASDHAYNLSTLAGVKVDQIKQNRNQGTLPPEPNPPVHYVAFLMSDGDNVQWLLNDFATSDRWFGAKERGRIPMAWQVSPSLGELAPSVLKWFYRQASPNDTFVSALSGEGYFFPKKFRSDAFQLHQKRLDGILQKLDLRVQVIMDDGMPTQSTLDAYGSLSTLGGFICSYGSKYVEGGGRIYWSAGKPFVSVKEALWESDPVALAAKINHYPQTPDRAEGYTLVVVNVWGQTYSDVVKLSENLHSNVKVVGPEEFLTRIRLNVKQ